MKRTEADAAPVPATRRFVPISYRVGDAAEMIGLSEAWVWERVKDGKLPACRIGGATVILHDDLYAFVASSRSPGDAAAKKAAQ